MGQVELAIALDGLGCEQHSVVTWNQLLAAGATPAWVKQQVQFGHLIRLAPRTYRFNGVARDWKMRASAALLSARAPALISHRSAAWLHGIDEHMPGIIDITVPRHRRPRARPGVQFHESRLFDVAAETAGVRDGLAVTGVARTILDSCAVVRGLPGRLDLLDEARRHKLVDWDQLWECLVIHTGRGRPGLKGYRDVLLTRDGIAPAGTLLFPGDTPEPPSQHDASGSCSNPPACRHRCTSIPWSIPTACTSSTSPTCVPGEWPSNASAGSGTTSSGRSRPTPSAATGSSCRAGSSSRSPGGASSTTPNP